MVDPVAQVNKPTATADGAIDHHMPVPEYKIVEHFFLENCLCKNIYSFFICAPKFFTGNPF